MKLNSKSNLFNTMAKLKNNNTQFNQTLFQYNTPSSFKKFDLNKISKSNFTKKDLHNKFMNNSCLLNNEKNVSLQSNIKTSLVKSNSQPLFKQSAKSINSLSSYNKHYNDIINNDPLLKKISNNKIKNIIKQSYLKYEAKKQNDFSNYYTNNESNSMIKLVDDKKNYNGMNIKISKNMNKYLTHNNSLINKSKEKTVSKSNNPKNLSISRAYNTENKEHDSFKNYCNNLTEYRKKVKLLYNLNYFNNKNRSIPISPCKSSSNLLGNNIENSHLNSNTFSTIISPDAFITNSPIENEFFNENVNHYSFNIKENKYEIVTTEEDCKERSSNDKNSYDAQVNIKNSNSKKIKNLLVLNKMLYNHNKKKNNMNINSVFNKNYLNEIRKVNENFEENLFDKVNKSISINLYKNKKLIKENESKFNRIFHKIDSNNSDITN